jgi:hypothetical protein
MGRGGKVPYFIHRVTISPAISAMAGSGQP